jgi:hypothetical protein
MLISLMPAIAATHFVFVHFLIALGRMAKSDVEDGIGPNNMHDLPSSLLRLLKRGR